MLHETLMNDIEFSDSFLCSNCFNRLQVTYKYPLTGWKKAVGESVCVCNYALPSRRCNACFVLYLRHWK